MIIKEDMIVYIFEFRSSFLCFNEQSTSTILFYNQVLFIRHTIKTSCRCDTFVFYIYIEVIFVHKLTTSGNLSDTAQPVGEYLQKSLAQA